VMETPGPSQDDLWFCESAVVLSTDTAAKLLCGLRGGTVLVFDMTISWPGKLCYALEWSVSNDYNRPSTQ
jgi:hypothetical protein